MPAHENSSIAEPEKKWRFGFWSLIATQFQGALIENALKFLVIYIALATEGMRGDRDHLELVVGSLFAIPFLLFSITGGFLPARLSQHPLTILTQLFPL